MNSPGRLRTIISFLGLSVALGNAQIINYTFEGSNPWGSTGSSAAILSPVNGASIVSGDPSGTGSSLSVSSVGPAYASASGVTGIGGLTSFTLAAWVNVASLPSSSTSYRIVSTLGGGQGLDFSLSGTASAFSLALGVNTTNAQISSAAAISGGSWLFVAATYTSLSAGTGTITFFTGSSTTAVTQLGVTRTITGASQGGGAVGETNGGASSTLQLGATPTTTNRTPNALIDDVSLYGSVLSTNQIDALRLSAIPEPGTTSLALLTGLAVLVGFRRKLFSRRA